MEPLTPAVRLLVVDDDEGIRTLLGILFRRSNIAVEFVADGGAALERLSCTAYDVILLDLMLPDKNGFEVIRELKAAEDQVLARTIVLTAASDRMLRDFDDARLIRRVMRKPFDIDDLVGEVRSAASGAQKAGAGGDERHRASGAAAGPACDERAHPRARAER